MPNTSKPYFRVIITSAYKTDDVRREHNQKLNNYLKYGQPYLDREVPAGMPPLPYEIEVETQSTSLATRNDNEYIMVTTLCCHDEYEEQSGEENNEYRS